MEPPKEPPLEPLDAPPPQLRRSTRTRQPTRVMLESVAQQDIEFHDFYGDTYYPMTIAFNTEYQAYYESMHEDDYNLQNELEDPIAFLVSTANDILYYHQAMKAPDCNEFQRAIHKEFNDHTVRQYWKLLPIDQVSEVKKVMNSVWAMKRKRNIVTNEIYKWKVRLNLHGGQQEYSVNFYETFSPLVSWIATRLLLIHSIIYKWYTRQVDYICHDALYNGSQTKHDRPDSDTVLEKGNININLINERSDVNKETHCDKIILKLISRTIMNTKILQALIPMYIVSTKDRRR